MQAAGQHHTAGWKGVTGAVLLRPIPDNPSLSPTQQPKHCLEPSAPQLPLRPTGTARLQRPLSPRAVAQCASQLVPGGSTPTALSPAAPAPRDGHAHSYLSHSCLHDLQAQLCLQLCLHLLCRWRADGQRGASPPPKRPPQETEPRDTPDSCPPQASSPVQPRALGCTVGAPSSQSLGRGTPQLGRGRKRGAGPAGPLPNSPAWLATSARERFWGFCRMRKVSAGPTTLPGSRGHSVRPGRTDPLPIPTTAQSLLATCPVPPL